MKKKHRHLGNYFGSVIFPFEDPQEQANQSWEGKNLWQPFKVLQREDAGQRRAAGAGRFFEKNR